MAVVCGCSVAPFRSPFLGGPDQNGHTCFLASTTTALAQVVDQRFSLS